MCCVHLFPEINIEHQTDSDIQTQQCGSFKAKMLQWIKKKSCDSDNNMQEHETSTKP